MYCSIQKIIKLVGARELFPTCFNRRLPSLYYFIEAVNYLGILRRQFVRLIIGIFVSRKLHRRLRFSTDRTILVVVIVSILLIGRPITANILRNVSRKLVNDVHFRWSNGGNTRLYWRRSNTLSSSVFATTIERHTTLRRNIVKYDER